MSCKEHSEGLVTKYFLVSERFYLLDSLLCVTYSQGRILGENLLWQGRNGEGFGMKSNTYLAVKAIETDLWTFLSNYIFIINTLMCNFSSVCIFCEDKGD